MYQGVYTSSHRIDNKDKEDLVVSVSYAVVDPDTMVVLQIKKKTTSLIQYHMCVSDLMFSFA